MYLRIFSLMVNIYSPTLTQTLSIFNVISPPLFIGWHATKGMEPDVPQRPCATHTAGVYTCLHICASV